MFQMISPRYDQICKFSRLIYKFTMTASALRKFKTFLHEAGLLTPDETATFTPLDGGVSSDIWRVETNGGTLCIKSALAKLKVDMDWYAPVARNAYEVAWMQKANQIVPGTAPQILAADPENGLFVMTYLPPETYPNWKTRLSEGHADPGFAYKVGDIISRIHTDTMNDPEIEQQFRSDDIFHAIRLEPYLEATADVHPELKLALMGLSLTTSKTKAALIHGDVSPKNILVGPNGPVILDAECAWYGEPAFDLAFCLNHFLLKCLWKPDFIEDYLSCFDAMVSGYHNRMGAGYADIELRAARLLPGLMLGRVDGRSPVEYLTSESSRNHLRRVSIELLKNPPSKLADIRQHWHNSLNP